LDRPAVARELSDALPEALSDALPEALSDAASGVPPLRPLRVADDPAR
jgi:hypothetical protein